MEQDIEKSGTFFRFEDLRVYHKALDYINWVYTKTSEFDHKSCQLLSNRFIDSAQNIALHIAEGSARNKSQFVYYLKMAKSSVRECVVHSSLAAKQMLINEDQLNESRGQLMEMTKMLGALIGSLQKSAGLEDSDDEI